MLNSLFTTMDTKWMGFFGILLAYAATCLLLSTCSRFLPKDGGREYAHDGKLSAGKPRGAGFLFVIVFTVATVLFVPLSNEVVIYLILVFASMMTGFLDDCAKTSWGEWKKGLLDLVVSVVVAFTFVNFNPTTVTFALFGGTVITLHPVLFGVLAMILTLVSINVTNCSDGVDGLSGTLSIITLASIYVINLVLGNDSGFNYMILLFIVCLIGYLWFNATPSRLMMGDAGSRAMGVFIAIAVLKTGSPLLYLLVALMLILDGGLGLIKVVLLRTVKVHILKHTLTPLHDHVRKNLGWSNAQVVFKFGIVQLMICVVVVWLLL